tara:strand:- start:803 stop:1345 length:543 start_codon:yes stop_codon:yes gene_type:complete
MGLKLFFFRRFFKKKLINIKLVVTDVDGVLTKGEIGYGDTVSDIKFFNVKDGLAAKLLHSNGLILAFISGGNSEAITKRAESLCVDECHTNIEDKSKTLKQIQQRLDIHPDSTLYIGDDINDLEVLPYVSIFVAPNDCNFQVGRKANIKLRSNGGEGVLREICDILLDIKDCNNYYLKSK